jgi:hypothetical protein
MTAANPQPYQNPSWGTPWGNQGWGAPPFWHPAGMGRPIGIAAMVLGFALFWPVGMAILAFMIAFGGFGCRRRRWQAWQNQNQGNQNQPPNGWQPSSPPWGRNWANWCGGDRTPAPPTSGNNAFDDYRAETLRRLEDEQTEFASYLERLRFAKDKAEFDQFMAERRQTPRPPATTNDLPQG